MGRSVARYDKLEEALLIEDAQRIEHERCLKFALNALWGSVENDKNWRKKNPYIVDLVERVIKE